MTSPSLHATDPSSSLTPRRAASPSSFLLRHLPLLLLLLASLSVKLYLASDPHLHPADERFHALVAKNLLHHPLVPTLYDNPALPYDYKQWDANHVWMHKQPVTLWLMAASMSLLGPTEFAARLPSVLLSTLAILLTYALAHRLSPQLSLLPKNHPSSSTQSSTLSPHSSFPLLAALFHTLHGMLTTLSAGFPATDHVDVLFAFFVELAIFLAVLETTSPQKSKQRLFLILLGLALGTALLTKWLTALLIVVVWLALRPLFPLRATLLKLTVIAALAALVFLPWQIYTQRTFPLETLWKRAYNSRHLTEVLEGQSRPVYQYLRDMLTMFSYLTPLAVLLFLLHAARHYKNHALVALALWFLIPYAFFSFVATKMPSYVMISAPAVFLMEAWLCHRLLTAPARLLPFLRPPQAALLARAFVALLILLTAAQSAILVIPRLRTNRWKWVDEPHAEMLATANALRALNSQIPDKSSVLFNVPHPIEAMFYTSLTAYPQLPSPAEIMIVENAHRPLLIADDGKTPIPESLRSNPHITILPVPRPL